MIKVDENKALKGIVGGITVYISGGLMCVFGDAFISIGHHMSFTTALLECAMVGGIASMVVAIPAFIWGWCMYARAKGYPVAFGLLSLLPLLGWITLLALPDRTMDAGILGFPVVFKQSAIFLKGKELE